VPPELVESLAVERGWTFDWEGFRQWMQKHSTSRTWELFQTGPIESLKKSLKSTKFLGYEATTAAAIVKGLIHDGKAVEAVTAEEQDGPVLVVLKTTYDESLRAVSPASLLRFAYFRALFDEGAIRSIEFYGKVMDWHLRWTSDVRTLYHVNAYRWPWVKRLHARSRMRQREENTVPASLADAPGGATSTENPV